MDSTTVVRDALDCEMNMDYASDCEVPYAPFGGKIALMAGSSLNTAWIPLANGSEAVYDASGFAYDRNPDWLGSSRLASTQQRSVYFDTAYSPYGVAYDSSGTSDLDFTGQNSLITNPSSSEVLSNLSGTISDAIDAAGLIGLAKSVWDGFGYLYDAVKCMQ